MRFLVLLALIGGLFYAYLQKEELMAHFLSKRLSCDVSIQRASIGLHTLTLKGVKIKNPGRSHFPYALDGGTICVETSPLNFFKKTIPVHQMTLQDATLRLELNNSAGSDNNWAKLLREFSQRQDGPGFIIDRLTVSNLAFDGLRSEKKNLSIPALSHMELSHVGAHTPLPLGQVSRILFQSILSTLTAKPHLTKLLEHVAPYGEKQKYFPPPEKNLAIQDGITTFRRLKFY